MLLTTPSAEFLSSLVFLSIKALSFRALILPVLDKLINAFNIMRLDFFKIGLSPIIECLLVEGSRNLFIGHVRID